MLCVDFLLAYVVGIVTCVDLILSCVELIVSCVDLIALYVDLIVHVDVIKLCDDLKYVLY